MPTISRALIAIVPSFLVAALLFHLGNSQTQRAIEAASSTGLEAAATYEVGAAIYAVGAVIVMCFGPALWVIATRVEDA